MDITRLVQAVQSQRTTDAFNVALTPEQWQVFAGFLVRREFAAGQTLMRQGEPGRSACIVEKGNLQVFTSGAAPGGQRIAVLRRGALVGEPSLFAAVRRAANVEAMAPCVVWELSAQKLSEMSERSPALALPVVRAAAAVMALRVQASLDGGEPLA